MTIRKRTALNGDTWWHCPACGAIHAVKGEAQACCGWQGDDEAAACCDAPAPVNGIDATLAERGSRYGEFGEHARIAQAIKRAMADSPNWPTLDADMRETLEMIAHKAGRILNGDPDYHDSWHDIVGYAKLVADRLLAEQNGYRGENARDGEAEE